MIVTILKTIIFGIIQGITEWLPISSTGHLILLNSFMPLTLFDDVAKNAAFFNVFKVVIQFGSILAVLLLYWHRLFPFGKQVEPKKQRRIFRLWLLIVIASLPLVVGMVIDKLVDDVLSTPFVIGLALIAYGYAFIWMENRQHQYTVETVKDITPKKAFGVGLFQLLAVIPGTSRSGSTILGATLLGYKRSVAAEFSFFLAIPAMFGASLLKLLKADFSFGFYGAFILLLGTVVSFIVSVIAIRYLMMYIRKHDFKIFGVYRIALGIVVLVFALLKWI